MARVAIAAATSTLPCPSIAAAPTAHAGDAFDANQPATRDAGWGVAKEVAVA